MRKVVFFIYINCLPAICFALTGWTEPVLITNVTGTIQEFAFSVTSDTGTGLFAYACNGGSTNNGVYFKNTAENNQTWTLNSFLSAINKDSLSPSTSGKESLIYNAWLENNSGVYRVLFLKGTAGDVVELSGGGNCTSVNIFAGSNSCLHTVWAENGCIYYRKGFNNGANWSDIKAVSGVNASNPSVLEAGGTLVVLWEGGAASFVKYSISTDGGLTWGGETNVSSSGIASLSCSVDSLNNVYAVWEQANKIYLRKYKAGSWEMEKTVSTNSSGTAKKPSVLADSDGIIYVVWSDNRAGGYKIYLSVSGDGGVNFTSEIILNSLSSPCRLVLGSFKKNIYLLYKESGQIVYRMKDTSAPSPVSIKSPAYHPAGGGSNNNCPAFLFEAADNEGGSGVKGFSYIFDKNPGTIPPEVINYTSNNLVFPRVENGNWYLHVKAVDLTGNWSPVSQFSMVINNSSLLPESEVWCTPNPVRSGQKPVIRYFIADASNTEFTVFNEAGESITSIKKEALAGVNEITEFDAAVWSNGVYFYRLKAKSKESGNSVQVVKKILLLR